jgi:xanthine dehydrogenase accessory factor
LTQLEFAKIMDNLVDRRETFAVATVVKIVGSTLGKPGFKEIISKDGEVVYGSLGGVCPDSAIVEVAKKAMAAGQPKMVKVFLEDVDKAVEGVVKSKTDEEIHVETNCGGEMEIYIEPYLPQERLIIIGPGGRDEIEDDLVKLGKITDFEVVVIDHSPVLTEKPDQSITDPAFDLSTFRFFESDAVVVLTHGAGDVEALAVMARTKVRYVGMMASRQRVMDDMNELRKMGIPDDFLASVHAPIGVDMGSVTAGEIALSIMAEIIAARRGKELPHRSAPKGERTAAPLKP